MEYIDRLDEYVFELRDFLAPELCAQWIADIEAAGFEPALVNSMSGPIRRPSLRNNDRLIRDDTATAEELYQRLYPYLSKSFRKRQVVGLNERFRFYRYDVGQKFDWHQDGYFERQTGERSLFTFMVYLNDDFEGGATSFADRQFGRFADFAVTPRRGSALVFLHPLVHRGDPVTAGRKYVMRSDVMYSREAF